ncbi:hypothetical protein [Prochlorococcus sp. MIT 1342]
MGQRQKSIVLVDSILSQNLGIDKNLNSADWQCFKIPQKASTQLLISSVLQSHPKGVDLHLIAHGKPGSLALGEGIDKEQLLVLAEAMAASQGRLLVWGCSVGVGLSQAEKEISGFHASETVLGRGQTLIGYGQLSELVASYNGELFHKGGATWTSKFGELEASALPTLNEEGFWSIPAKKAHLTRLLRIDSSNKIPQDLLEKIPVEIISEEEDFSDWYIRGMGGDFDFSLPEIISAEVGNPDRRSKYISRSFTHLAPKTLRSSGVEANAELTGIKVVNGEVYQWTVNADAENLNFKGLSLDGKLEVSFDKTRATYAVQGNIKMQNKDPLGIINGVALSASDVQLKHVVDSTGAYSWQVQGWDVEGELEAEVLNSIGLDLRGNATVNAVYKLSDENYEYASTTTIKDFKAKVDSHSFAQGVFDLDVQVEAKDVVLKQVTVGEGDGTKQSWQAQSWQIESQLKTNFLSSIGFNLDSNAKALVGYQLKDSDYGEATTYTIISADSDISSKNVGQEVFSGKVKASDVVLKRITAIDEESPQWQAQSWEVEGELRVKPLKNVGLKIDSNVKANIVYHLSDSQYDDASTYRVKRLDASIISDAFAEGIFDSDAKIKARDVVLKRITAGESSTWQAQSWNATGVIDIEAGEIEAKAEANVAYQLSDDDYGDASTYRISSASLSVADGSAKGVFSSEVTARDVVLKRITASGSPTWQAQSWNATGVIDIEAGEIEAKAEANVAYQLSDDDYGDASTYRISSASLSVADGSAKGVFNSEVSSEVTARDVVLKRITASGSPTWQAQSWNATGDININAGEIKAKAEANVAYQLSDDDYGDASTYRISSASLSVEDGSAEGVFSSEVTARDVVLKRITASGSPTWQAQSWNATGVIDIEAGEIKAKAEANVAYQLSDDDYGDASTYRISSASLSVADGSAKGVFNSEVSSEVTARDVVLKRITASGSPTWQAQSWNATGDININAGEIKAKAEANVAYQLSDDDYGDASTYRISSASLSVADGSAKGVFSSEVTARDVVLKRITASGSPTWQAQSWNATGVIDIEAGEIEAKAEANVAYQLSDDDYGDASTYRISSASLSVADGSAEGVFNSEVSSEVTARDVVLKRITASGSPTWQAQSWNATGDININAGEIKAKAEANVAYQLSDDDYGDASTYRISSASLSVEDGSAEGVFSSEVTARDVVLKRITASGSPTWQAQSWNATGVIDIEAGEIKAKAEANVAYQLSDDDYGDASTYRISSASLSVADGSAKGVFNSEVSSEVTARDVVLKRITASGSPTWQAQSWNATGDININAGEIKAKAEANVAYQLSDDDYGDASTYRISSASLSVADGSAKGVFSSEVTARDVVLKRITASGSPTWQAQSWNATGVIDIEAGEIEAKAEANVAYQLSDDDYGDASTYRISSASLSVADGSAKGVFSSEVTARDVLLKRITAIDTKSPTWEAQSWNATGVIDIEAGEIEAKAEANVAYQLSDDDYGDASTYRISSASLSVADGSAKGVFSSDVTARDVLLKRITAGESSTWEAQSWNATGVIDIEAGEIKAKAEANVAYQLSDDDYGDASTYRISSASLSVADGSAKGVFSSDVTARDVLLKRITAIDAKSPTWEAQSWNATGVIDIEAGEIEAKAEANVAYQLSDDDYGDASTYRISSASLSVEDGSAEGVFSSEVTARDVVLKRITAGESSTWEAQSWNATGVIDINAEEIKAKAEANVAYQLSDDDYGDASTYRISSASLSVEAGSAANGVFNSAVNSEVTARDVLLKRITAIDTKSPTWEAQSWNATGVIDIEAGEIKAKAEANVAYQLSDDDYGDASTYRISSASLSVDDGSAKGVFSSDVTARDVLLKRITAGESSTWEAQSWNATGVIDIEAGEIEAKAEANVAYQLSDDDYGDASTYRISSASLSVADGSAKGVFSSDVTARDVLLKRITAGESSTWEAQSWNATGVIDIEAGEIEAKAEANVAYQLSDDDYGDASTYRISSASLSVEDGSAEGVFSSEVTARDVVLKRITAGESSTWEAQSWNATGVIDIDAGEIKAKAEANVAYQLSDDDYGDASTYRISSASLSVEAGSAANGVFNSAVNSEVTARDVVLTRDTDWKAQSWNATGVIAIDAGEIEAKAEANVAYQLSDDDYGGDSTYRISSASLSVDDGSAKGVFSSEVTARDVVLKRITAGESSTWQAQSWNATGVIAIDAGEIEAKAEANVAYQLSDDDYGGDSTYRISSASLSVEAGSAANGVFNSEVNSEVTARDVVLTRDTDWKAQSWNATGVIAIDAGEIEAKAEANVAYQLSDDDYGGDSTYRISSASLSVEAGSAANGVFNSEVNSEVTARDVVLTRDTDWKAQSWNATGVIAIDAGEIEAKAEANVAYQLSDDDYGGDSTYRISSASLSADVGSAKGVFSSEVTARDVVLTRDTDWKAQSWNATGDININAGHIQLNATGTVNYLLNPDSIATYEISSSNINFELKKRTTELKITAIADDILLQSIRGNLQTQNWTARGDIAFESAAFDFKVNSKVSYTRESDDLAVYTISGGEINFDKTNGIEGTAALEYIKLEDTNDGFNIKEWKAKGDLKIQGSGGLTVETNAEVVYTYDEGEPTYKIQNASIEIEGESPFQGGITANKILIKENTDGGLYVKDFNGEAHVNINQSGVGVNTSANFDYNYVDEVDLDTLGDKIYTISKATVDVNVADFKSSAEAEFRYIQPAQESSQRTALGQESKGYFRYLIGNIGTKDNKLNLGSDLNLDLDAGLMLGMVENNLGDSLWALNGGISFNDLGFVDTLHFEAGTHATTDTFKSSLIDTIDSPDIRQVTQDNWNFGEIRGGFTDDIDIGGLFEIGGVSATYSDPHDMEYGLYKYKSTTSDGTQLAQQLNSQQDRKMKISVQDIKLNLGYVTSALSDIGKSLKSFTGNIKDIIDILTAEVKITSGIPSALASPVVDFIESTPGNIYRDGKIQLIEILDITKASSEFVQGNDPVSLTPAVKDAQAFVELADKLIAINATPDSDEFTLAEFEFDVNLSTSQNEPFSTPLSPIGLGTDLEEGVEDILDNMEGEDDGFDLPAAIDNKGQGGTNITFPLFSKAGAANLIYNYFLSPDAKNTLAKLDLDFNLNVPIPGGSVPVPFFPLANIGLGGTIGANVKTSLASEISINDVLNLYDTSATQDSVTLSKSIADLALKSSVINLQDTVLNLDSQLDISIELDAFIGAISATAGLKGVIDLEPRLKLGGGEPSAEQQISLQDIFGTISDSKPAKLNGHISPPLGLYDVAVHLNTNALDGDESFLEDSYLHVNIVFDKVIYFDKHNPDNYHFSKPQNSSDYLAISSTGWIHNKDSLKVINSNDYQTVGNGDKKVAFNFTDFNSAVDGELNQNSTILIQLKENIKNDHNLTDDKAGSIVSKLMTLAIPKSTETIIAKETIGSSDVEILRFAGLDDDYRVTATSTYINEQKILKDKNQNPIKGDFSWEDFTTFEQSMTYDQDEDYWHGSPFLFLDLPELYKADQHQEGDIPNYPPILISFEIGSTHEDILTKISGELNKVEGGGKRGQAIRFDGLLNNNVTGTSSNNCTIITRSVEGNTEEDNDEPAVWKHHVSILLTYDDLSPVYDNVAKGEWGLKLSLNDDLLIQEPFTTGITNPWCQYGYSLAYSNANSQPNANTLNLTDGELPPKSIENGVSSQLVWIRPYSVGVRGDLQSGVNKLDIIEVGDEYIYLTGPGIEDVAVDQELEVWRQANPDNSRFARKDEWNLAATFYDHKSDSYRIGFVSMDANSEIPSHDSWYEALEDVNLRPNYNDTQKAIPFVSNTDNNQPLGKDGKFESLYSFGLNSDLESPHDNSLVASKLLEQIFLAHPQQIVNPLENTSKESFNYWSYLSSALLTNDKNKNPGLTRYDLDYFVNPYVNPAIRDYTLNGVTQSKAEYSINNYKTSVLLPRQADNVPRLKNIVYDLNDDWEWKSEWKSTDDHDDYEKWRRMSLDIIKKYQEDPNFRSTLDQISSDLFNRTGTKLDDDNLETLFADNYSTLLYDNNLQISPQSPYVEMPLNRPFSFYMSNQEQYQNPTEPGFLNPFPVSPFTFANDLYIDYNAAISANLSADARVLWHTENIANIDFPIYSKKGSFPTGISFKREAPLSSGGDLLYGDSENDDLSGGDENDMLIGGKGDDILRGKKGNDKIDGGDGNDILNGNQADDEIIGGDGDDILSGNHGDDDLYGGFGADILRGNRGDDYLSGGNGNDIIQGDLGNDQLRGGAGEDSFVFSKKQGKDTILDFDSSEDMIILLNYGEHLDTLTFKNKNTDNDETIVGVIRGNYGLKIKLEGVDVESDQFADEWSEFISSDSSSLPTI